MTDTGAPTTTDTDRGARRLAAWLLPALALAQVALVLGADLAVRGTVEQLVAGQLAAVLEADEADVEVAIGGVSVLAQGLTGSVDEVRLRVAEGEYGSLDELSAHRGYGALLRALREQSRVCIADQLPDGFELTALTARDGTLVAELRAPHVRLGALSFDRLGSCV